MVVVEFRAVLLEKSICLKVAHKSYEVYEIKPQRKEKKKEKLPNIITI